MEGEVQKKINNLRNSLQCELYTDQVHRILYATDASVYKEMPVAVAIPRNLADLRQIISFAVAEKIPVIPRGAGTSLAGQVVGSGMVIDMSKYFTEILELNVEERWVRVQPGVILNQLNNYLKPYDLFFSPETSTASRCTIGGMLGNNSCGLHSIIYGSVRDHTLEVQVILSDGSETLFRELSAEEFVDKCQGDGLESKIYQKLHQLLSAKSNQDEIRREYPDKSLIRRNTGYAIDLLLESSPFTPGREKFNFCKLLAGSEGTLAFATEIKLNLIPLPPREKGVICAHFHTLEEALQANLIALKHKPGAVELIDDQILKLTEKNIQQKKNRFFVKGEPGAILIIEFARESRQEILQITKNVEKDMRAANFGYHFPVIFDQVDINKVWALRKAALGLLYNLPGDAKPVTVIEDTAVNPQLMPEYIAEFKEILKKYNLACVYHAHIGSGELHLRPILNLKDKNEVEQYREIASDTAKLVKKYRGSLSGEHGDGRLRGEFLPLIIGPENYRLLKEIKQTWDPHHIFNPGKITDVPRMNTHLRYLPGQETKELDTFFDFTDSRGLLRAIEKCNGAGDCLNTADTGDTMCPSYQATLDEERTTRGRANILREFLSDSSQTSVFDQKEVYDILAECLSCKACKSECPTSVDMTKIKAEFLQHYYDKRGAGLRNWMIANFSRINRLGSFMPFLYNFITSNRLTAGILKKLMGFAGTRPIPGLGKTTLAGWARKNLEVLNRKISLPLKTVYLFNDEFTNYQDVEIGIKVIKLLTSLNYQVIIPKHVESGRTYLSKGFVRQARKIVKTNLTFLKDIVSKQRPLIGIEPSAILTFRDEYLDLAEPKFKATAQELAASTYMIDEFLAAEMEAGNISRESFSREKRAVKFHGHCYQKSLASTAATRKMLSFPLNYSVEEIPSGCCGMAGSFGYEQEHYELSLKIAELKLLPAIRQTEEQVLLAASGTSCRQQIKDNSGRHTYHPAEILYDALLVKDEVYLINEGEKG